MDDLELMPPALPGTASSQNKGGFFKKFFLKEEQTPAAPKAAPAEQRPSAEVDLEDIKRRLGLYDEAGADTITPSVERDEIADSFLDTIPAAEEAPAPVAVKAPVERVIINDWTAEGAATAAPVHTSSWDAEPEALPVETPVHHEAVEQQFSKIDAAHEEVATTIREAAPVEVPDWKLQTAEVAPERYFILRNGSPVRSVKELMTALEYIDDSTFTHHVNEYRNDFASWLHSVVDNAELAEAVRAAPDRNAIMAILQAHYKDAAKQVVKEQKQIDALAQKRAKSVQKLRNTEDQIKQIRTQLERKTKELLDERKRSSQLVKGALDKEVERRLAHERVALQKAVEEVKKGRAEQKAKIAEYDEKLAALAERENAIAPREQKARELEQKISEQRKMLAQEKLESTAILKDAAAVRKNLEDTKKRQAQTEANLKAIEHREIEISRHEETLRQREKKITADLTRISQETEKLQKLREEHGTRESAVAALEAQAAKVAADAERRNKDAVEMERAATARVRAETKKLENVRKQIDRALAKVLKNKQKITTAVQLRKHLEETLLSTKEEVAKERAAVAQDSYRAIAEAVEDETPIGQPQASDADDILRVKNVDLYEKIARARSALEQKDLGTAKRLYNELRDEFGKLSTDTPERSALYVSIRELYDDIHLLMLEH